VRRNKEEGRRGKGFMGRELRLFVKIAGIGEVTSDE
jgi:hypothetical protein